jgi:hypothetical protein
MKRKLVLLFVLLCLAVPAHAQVKLQQSHDTTWVFYLKDLTTGGPKTGVTITGITGTIVKQHDTLSTTKTTFACAASATTHDCNEIGNGFYSTEIPSADVDTVGRWSISMAASGAHDDAIIAEVVCAGCMDVLVVTGPAVSPFDANLAKILGTTVATPATAGLLDVNIKNINGVATVGLRKFPKNVATSSNAISFFSFLNGVATKGATGVGCRITIGGAADAALTATPTEREFTPAAAGAIWYFGLTQAETNADFSDIACTGTNMDPALMHVEFEH